MSKDLVHITPAAIAEVEGEMVRRMEAKLPGMTLQMDYGYPRNTFLRLETVVRVQSFTVDEIRAGVDKGQLVRRHNMAIEEVKVIGVYTAEQMEQGVGGGLSAAAVAKEEADEQRRADGAGQPGPGAADAGADPAAAVPGAATGAVQPDPGF